ncbi:DUF7673 family protein [Nisaea denitrificans]|uniref:DUF7673 family protein n=1 Tax=Nisaea denitrificans TaxID=390877 RepID=UPI000416E80A|nr:hypothetical protein [Nisaea denitrificans]
MNRNTKAVARTAPMPSAMPLVVASNDVRSETALDRLFSVAVSMTGQGKRVADFLLAVWNAEFNGAWDPVDLWMVDRSISDDMFAVLKELRDTRSYPCSEKYGERFADLVDRWRADRGDEEESQHAR